MNWKDVTVGVIIGAILGIGGTFFALSQRTTRLETQVEHLKTQIEKLPTGETKADTPKTPKEDRIAIDIPLDAGWKPQGPGADGGGYREGTLVLKADLRGGDAYAELFLDLRAVRLPGVERNLDGSYNLVGKELIALVRSDQNFKGNPARPNGAQFLLKNEKWENRVGTWLNITDAMITSSGMEVFYKVPDDAISRNVAGISLKLTIGSNSRETYRGSFIVHRVKIAK